MSEQTFTMVFKENKVSDLAICADCKRIFPLIAAQWENDCDKEGEPIKGFIPICPKCWEYKAKLERAISTQKG